ncbi:hypothetical protein PLCT2_02720 [Planctomycetaceae bacterium]|nr:hypothetical protein PLCT2_02720 [Planctomycetaceae bacterium]
MEWKETTFATLAACALLVVVTGVTQAQMFASASLLDQKNMGELKMSLELITVEDVSKKKVRAMKEISGRAFWSECLKAKVIDAEMLGKLASLGSACGDTPSDGKWLDEETGKLDQRHCSYTSPKAEQLMVALNLKGSKRCVLFAFDSRNWNNYGKKGVLVAWSEGDADFLTENDLVEVWKHPADNWKDPAGKIIGQLKPFDRTFQDAECAAYVNPDAPKKDDTDYKAVYRKKGRSWTFSGTEKHGDKEVTRRVRFTVKEVKDNVATVVTDQLNDEGEIKPDGSDESEIDLTDASLGRPSRCKPADDAESEIEAAGKKWKVRKWVQFDGKRTYWMSTEIPGLIIKGEMSNGAKFVLAEFKDGE